MSILDEREKTYGGFVNVANVYQRLKDCLPRGDEDRLSDVQATAMDMCLMKIARIVCGDPTYLDSWVDLAGYAELVVREMRR